MSPRKFAVITVLISVATTCALISEGFVSYGGLSVSELQAILQTRIVGFGAAILLLQIVAILALAIDSLRVGDGG